jgi:hypothetical protein
MSLWREKTLVKTRSTVPYNAPASYPVPYGKSKFTVSGKGADGKAASGGNSYAYATGVRYNISTYSSYGAPSPSGNISYRTNSSPGSSNSTGTGATTPAPTSSYDHGTFAYAYDNANGTGQLDASGTRYQSINYSYSSTTYATGYNPYVAATTGSPSTFLGVTFPGGAGGPATAITNVPVIIPASTTSAAVTVPSGGYVNITNS